MNHSDSERIASVLEDLGYSPAPNEVEADLIVINVCSVRQRAVDRIFGQCQKFVKLKILNHKLKTILTGCILKEDKKKFQDKVDLIFDIRNLSQLPNLLKRNSLVPTHQCIGTNLDYLEIKPRYQSKFSAYVPVMNGCNNFCSYCVVPYVRGREYSRPVKGILNEVKELVKKRYKEITLLGQNVNSYSCNKISFPKLLKMVNDIEGDFWLRFVTSHPKDMSDELIDTVANCEKVCEYIHLPVQCGNDKILEKMNRGYTTKQYLALVKKIRAKIPNVAITTDSIVGFPGETKKQFENTVKLFKKVGFDMAYIAQYSPRADTAAAKLKDNIPHEEKKRRKEVLTEMLRKTALKNNKKYIGKTVDVLLMEHETYNMKQKNTIGKTRSFKNVQFIPDSRFQIPDSNLVGSFTKVKITRATPWGLKGRPEK